MKFAELFGYKKIDVEAEEENIRNRVDAALKHLEKERIEASEEFDRREEEAKLRKEEEYKNSKQFILDTVGVKPSRDYISGYKDDILKDAAETAFRKLLREHLYNSMILQVHGEDAYNDYLRFKSNEVKDEIHPDNIIAYPHLEFKECPIMGKDSDVRYMRIKHLTVDVNRLLDSLVDHFIGDFQ